MSPRMLRTMLVAASATTAVMLGGCADRSGAEAAVDAAAEEGDAPTNRVAIPPAVRSNLGVTFATVEPRVVEKTLRVPGRFELLPDARREYRTMFPGRVELLVDQFDRVEPLTPLYKIDSPAWRDLQQRLSEAEASIRRYTARLDTFEPLMSAHQVHEESLDESIRVWRERVEQLRAVREAGGGRINEIAEAQSALADAQAEHADVQEKEAQLNASRSEAEAELDAARSRRELLLDSAASLLHVPVEELEAIVDGRGNRRPRWRTIDMIEVVAEEAGVVESLGLTNGAWADQESPVVTTVQPHRLRFRAQGLQSDLGVLRDGLPARIVSPTPTRTDAAIDMLDTMTGVLRLGLTGNPDDRTIPLFVVPETLSAWARPGVSAQLEIVTDTTASAQLAVPLAAVQRDGLEPVLFRRDPRDPNQAIRLAADLGTDDGRWVAVRSGLRAGDEVVLDGAFQLMLATSGTMQAGGHFHADGTFHQEED